MNECIAKYIQTLGLELYAISPLESAKVRKSQIRDGEHYSITRKGNGILRSCLYLAVSQMLTQKLDNQITRFYFKKKSSGLSHKVAAVASCRKLACCVFGMLKNGTCFETI